MATAKTISEGILRSIAFIALAVVVLYFFYHIQTVIIYLIVSLILTLIGNPIVKFFRKRLKFSNTLATVATLLIYVFIIAGFIWMFVPLIVSQSESLSVLNTDNIQNSMQALLQQIDGYLNSFNMNSKDLLKSSNLSSKLDFNFIPLFLNTIVDTVSGFGMGLASTLFITFFFLKDKMMFIDGIKTLMPQRHEDRILNSLDKINDLLSRYFIGLLLQLFIVFILYLIVLLIFGMENAVIIAFLCAVLNIIPYIGPIIASVLVAVLTMISNLGSDFQSVMLPQTVYVLIGFSIVQIIDNNVSQPIIFSKSTYCHPLEIFLVILTAGFLFGILGMIAAVPIYTMLKVIGKEFFPDNKIIQLLTKNI
ncbi:MAG: AI-2E family transporter [Flavobacterium sp.]|nr:AI-2E family transporter [Flavobacterium sp.]